MADSILRLTRVPAGCWIWVAAVSSPGGWIQVTADFILRLTPAARNELLSSYIGYKIDHLFNEVSIQSITHTQRQQSSLRSNQRSNLRSNQRSSLRSNLRLSQRSNLRSNLKSSLTSNQTSNLRSNHRSNQRSNLRLNQRSNLRSNLSIRGWAWGRIRGRTWGRTWGQTRGWI